MRRLSFLSCVVAATLVGVGCGSESGTESNNADESARGYPRGYTAPPEPKDLTLVINEDGETLRGRNQKITGTTEPGASVTVNADTGITEATASPNGKFKVPVELDEIGENELYVKATLEGFEDEATRIYVTRERTAAEARAYREAQQRKREQELAELRAAPATDPELLQKNPDRHAGEKIAISGEIFQIQERPGGGGFFLMNTMCSTEYDITICDGPTVYVTYKGTNDLTEDDLVTVYGVVRGGYEYDTQAGGSNYVAHIAAKILE